MCLIREVEGEGACAEENERELRRDDRTFLCPRLLALAIFQPPAPEDDEEYARRGDKLSEEASEEEEAKHRLFNPEEFTFLCSLFPVRVCVQCKIERETNAQHEGREVRTKEEEVWKKCVHNESILHDHDLFNNS